MRTSAERFWGRVDIQELEPSACWVWTGGRTKSPHHEGYGRAWDSARKRMVQASRLAYELCIGPVPDGLEVDHVAARGCATTLCVNPAHLEAVTHKENLMRGNGWGSLNARKTHCREGHPLSGKNLSVDARGGRVCLACNRRTNRAHLARKRARENPETS